MRSAGVQAAHWCPCVQGIRYWMWSPLAYREVAAEALAGSASTARATSSELVFKQGAHLASDLLAYLPNGILHNGDEAGYLYASKAKQPQNGEAPASLPMHLYRHLTRRPSLDFRVRAFPCFPGRGLERYRVMDLESRLGQLLWKAAATSA